MKFTLDLTSAEIGQLRWTVQHGLRLARAFDPAQVHRYEDGVDVAEQIYDAWVDQYEPTDNDIYRMRGGVLQGEIG